MSDDLEARVEALEEFANGVSCSGKHRYMQGAGELSAVLYCVTCGNIMRITTEEKRYGFSANGDGSDG